MSRSLQVIGILIVFISIVGVASATISVGNIVISPSGDLVSGLTQSSATFKVNFGSSGGKTFESSNSLQMETELEDATWSYNIILDGVENPAKTEAGPNIRLSRLGALVSLRSRDIPEGEGGRDCPCCHEFIRKDHYEGTGVRQR